MKKGILFLLTGLLLLCLPGCREGAGEVDETYQIYFAPKFSSFGDAALVAEIHPIDGQEPVRQLLGLLLRGPESERLKAVIPAGVTVQSWALDDGILTVDFSGQYGALSGIELTLADYSVTMTLSQIPSVTSVVTTVEGDRITYRDHQNLKEGDVLLSVYRREPEQRQVTLFFPQGDQQGLGTEERSITLGEDESMSMAVLRALVEGPKDESLQGVLGGMELISVRVEKGACRLNLTAAFEEQASGIRTQDSLVIDSLASTLCQLDNISSVRFLVEGEALARYGAVDLSQPIEARTLAPVTAETE